MSRLRSPQRARAGAAVSNGHGGGPAMCAMGLVPMVLVVCGACRADPPKVEALPRAGGGSSVCRELPEDRQNDTAVACRGMSGAARRAAVIVRNVAEDRAPPETLAEAPHELLDAQPELDARAVGPWVDLFQVDMATLP